MRLVATSLFFSMRVRVCVCARVRMCVRADEMNAPNIALRLSKVAALSMVPFLRSQTFFAALSLLPAPWRPTQFGEIAKFSTAVCLGLQNYLDDLV